MIHKIRYEIHPEDRVLLSKYDISEKYIGIVLHLESNTNNNMIIGVNDYLVVHNKVLELEDGKIETDYEKL